MNLYEVLGVVPEANQKTIAKAFRVLAKRLHPDTGGDAEEYDRVVKAYQILSDPEKRARYDRTGRTDSEQVTRDKINSFIRSIIHNVVNVRREDGTTDDPTWENIKTKVVKSLRKSRKSLQEKLIDDQRRLRRARQLLKRFKCKGEEDPIGDALREEIESIQEDIYRSEDSLKLSEESEKVIDELYHYEMGPDPEGQDESDPTLRLTSGGVLYVR